MRAVWQAILHVAVLVGCSGEERAVQQSPEKVEKMRQQYIEQAKAFNARSKPGQSK
jgi:hypothetical protein